MAFEDWTDEQLGQHWADCFVWYLMELHQGKRLLDDTRHKMIAGKLETIDKIFSDRGLPASPDYSKAFRNRVCLSHEKIQSLMVQAYGRKMTIHFKEGETW